MSGQSVTTLFLGKPSGGSLPVFSDHSFASNLQLALKREFFPQKNVPDARVDLETARFKIGSGHTTE